MLKLGYLFHPLLLQPIFLWNMCNELCFPLFLFFILAHKLSNEVFLKHIQNSWPNRVFDKNELQIRFTHNTSNKSPSKQPEAARDHRRTPENMQQKHQNFRKTTNKINNAKPQPPLTKSMPTVDCYSNQSQLPSVTHQSRWKISSFAVLNNSLLHN